MTGATPGPGAAPEALAFRPAFGLANPHLQSILPSQYPRRAAVRVRTLALCRASEAEIVECGAGVRLLGHYTPPRGDAGLVVLLHGWEGSADSLYILSAAHYLWRRGFAVFRLNFRDHGPTHHLNAEIFHSCRIAEVVGAVRAIARRHGARGVSLAGFSLGGNFALRVAARAPAAGFALKRVVAVSPVLDPAHTMAALDGGSPVYRLYFLRKWRESLNRKARAWPHRYDFSDALRCTDLTSMTARLVARFSEFADLRSYLAGYAITGEALAGLSVPARIITAADDPIIPAADLARLARPASLSVGLSERGGHVGYLDSLFGASWADREIHATLAGTG